MKTVLAYTYYEAPLMLRKQLEYWQQYPKEVSKDVKIILVDDGSPTKPALKVLEEIPTPIELELYRVKEDINQNTYGARNLAFHVAPGDTWIWNLDIDHVVPWESVKIFSDMGLPFKRVYYTPAREIFVDRQTSQALHRHADTFILTKETYWKTGGYDEDFVGFYYNGPSIGFRYLLKTTAKEILTDENVKTIFFSNVIVQDASPIANDQKKRYEGLKPKKSPRILKFNWERIL